MTNVRSVLIVLLGALLGLCTPPTARADEVAPELEGSDLHVRAQAELKRLFSAMGPSERRRLVGAYVAFDSTVADPIAQIACDDDGDYVIVLSDAMLRLIAHVARAASYDETNGTRTVEDYAAFLVRSQTPGRRLLPPPPGSYVADKPGGTYEERLVEALSFVVARELAHLRAGDHVCPRPSATKESGDEVWTSAEQRRAGEIAGGVYTGRQAERDNEAIVRVLESGRTEKGALALLRLFAQFEVEGRLTVPRFSPTYLTHHPGASARLASVKQAVEARSAGHD